MESTPLVNRAASVVSVALTPPIGFLCPRPLISVPGPLHPVPPPPSTSPLAAWLHTPEPPSLSCLSSPQSLSRRTSNNNQKEKQTGGRRGAEYKATYCMYAYISMPACAWLGERGCGEEGGSGDEQLISNLSNVLVGQGCICAEFRKTNLTNRIALYNKQSEESANVQRNRGEKVEYAPTSIFNRTVLTCSFNSACSHAPGNRLSVDMLLVPNCMGFFRYSGV